MWPKMNFDAIIPPLYRKKPGKPRKLKRREPDEDQSQTKLRRTNTSITCRKCKEYGHNSGRCPNFPSTPEVGESTHFAESPTLAPEFGIT